MSPPSATTPSRANGLAAGCHIGGDFLLIYEVEDGGGKGGAIVFVRAGKHAELFRERSYAVWEFGI